MLVNVSICPCKDCYVCVPDNDEVQIGWLGIILYTNSLKVVEFYFSTLCFCETGSRKLDKGRVCLQNDIGPSFGFEYYHLIPILRSQ